MRRSLTRDMSTRIAVSESFPKHVLLKTHELNVDKSCFKLINVYMLTQNQTSEVFKRFRIFSVIARVPQLCHLHAPVKGTSLSILASGLQGFQCQSKPNLTPHHPTPQGRGMTMGGRGGWENWSIYRLLPRMSAISPLYIRHVTVYTLAMCVRQEPAICLLFARMSSIRPPLSGSLIPSPTSQGPQELIVDPKIWGLTLSCHSSAVKSLLPC